MLLTTITPSVSQSTITKVTRLFNGTLTDVAHELFQNARRAGATRLVIHTATSNGQPTITFYDDGCGIDDPSSIVTLGHSGWDAATCASEDPAGMGVFSLAGRRVTIESFSAAFNTSWKATIEADQWDGSRPIPLEQGARHCGTAITIDLSPEWTTQVGHAIAQAARHYPLPVELNRELQHRRDFLDGAIRITEWNGSRIGIFNTDRSLHQINFHGVTVPCRLPSLHEVDSRRAHYVQIDIGDTPSLQLVLPARKEMVQNGGLADLKDAAERILFETVSRYPAHRLSHEDWSRARELGIELPEAEAVLRTWFPQIADSDTSSYGGFASRPINAAEAVLCPDYEPAFAQPFGRALRNHALRPQIAHEVTQFEGYSWYAAVPRIVSAHFAVTDTDQSRRKIDQDTAAPADSDHHQVQKISLVAIVQTGSQRSRRTAQTDIAFANTQECWDGLDAAQLLWTGDGPPIDDLVDLLDAAFFSSSDDRDCDSWDTQHRAFTAEASTLVCTQLSGPDAAIAASIERLLSEHLWILPGGRTLTISIADRAISVELAPLSIAA
jgi:hypothetical protein